jgi:hypothetical protein
VDLDALGADSKLIVSWLVRGRDSEYAIEFMDDLRHDWRTACTHERQAQGYLEAVEGAFGLCGTWNGSPA